MPLEACNFDSVFGKPILFVDSLMDFFSCFDKLFNVAVREVCSVTYAGSCYPVHSLPG